MRSTLRVLALAAAAAAAKVTIDDANPRWTYDTNGWGGFTKSNGCAECQVKVDPDVVNGGTWHDTSADTFAVLNVTAASSISVFTVCPGPLPAGGRYHLNVSFELDGKPAGEFEEKIEGCGSIEYNYKIYQNTKLKLGPHTLKITNRLPDPTQQTSDLIIDYAVIEDGTPATAGSDPSSTPSGSPSGATTTPEEPTESHSSSVPVAAIVVPILAVVAIVAALGSWWWRRRRQHAIDDALAATPYRDVEPGTRSYTTAVPSEGFQTQSYGPSASLYSGANRSVRAETEAESSVLYISRDDQQAHDTQLEAALAIIADRAGRTPGSAAPNPALAQARRPEKAVYHPYNAGESTLERSTTLASSTTASHFPDHHQSHAPPSYLDTVSR